jgi:3-hydroxyisobutyrate dehydrogenase-like beta-hydroxyacid dehydrogenase
MLPSSPQVITVYRDGIIPSINKLSATDARNTLFIDSTTLDITVARDIANDVNATGACMVDAPVSGGNGPFFAYSEQLTLARSHWCQSRLSLFSHRRH